MLRVRSGADLVGLAFDELRRAAGPHPTVTTYLLASIEVVGPCLEDTPAAPEVRAALRRQAELAVAESEHAGVPEWDLLGLRRRLAALDLG